MSEAHANFSDHIPKMPEGFRIFPSNLRRFFDHIEIHLSSLSCKTAKLGSIYIRHIVIFACEDIIFIFTCEDIMFSQEEKSL